MVQRVCDACRTVIETGTEYVVLVAEPGDGAPTYEDLHTDCVDIGERISQIYDAGAVRVEVLRKKW